STIPMERSAHDDPDPSVPSNWIVWQLPFRDLSGKWFSGFTRWVSKAVRRPPISSKQWLLDSVVEFMRFENIDENPAPERIRISWSASGTVALRVPHYEDPLLSVAQEPSVVRLPDNRLFCTMRTMTGYIWYSVSDDDGYTWCSPRPLLRRDHGSPILQPIFGCPVYPLSDGRYILIHHNNSGRLDGCEPENANVNRRPCYIALGEFRPEAEQPLWFSESKVLMDNDNVPLGPRQGIDIGGYTSFTNRNGEDVLWHPERKFFLLGKKITSGMLSVLEVPGY
ncbi:MAG: exo-alpha-sialidase, partial [Spirochaetales bacterium]|nr:exo-alpha-sialidase [Spirochaetales bacterium]